MEEEFEPVKFTEKDYEEAVQRLKQHYPKIGRRVYKTPTKSWKQVYDEMLAIIEKEKWTPKTKTKTNR
jgi:diphthamide synthase subunit DPH2